MNFQIIPNISIAEVLTSGFLLSFISCEHTTALMFHLFRVFLQAN